MRLHILNESARIALAKTAVAAGTTDVNGDGIDMQLDGGYDSVAFLCLVGTLTLTQVTSLKAQASDDNGSSDSWGDIEGSDSGNLADTDDDKLLVLDVVHPIKRWIRPVLLRGTANAVLNAIIAIQYNGRTPPAVNSADVVKSLNLVDAIEGTP